MSDSLITTEQRGHLLLIGLNRPDKYNAFTVEMLQALSAAYTELENNDDLWVGVLFANGKHFTAGLDLADVAPSLKDRGGLFAPGTIDPLGMTGDCKTKPVVCALHGRVFTIGIELMLNCEVAIASRDARFEQIEVKRGILPFGGATHRFVQTAGYANAMRYMLTGDSFDADEALRMGMVQQITEPGRQLDAAIKVANRIAAQAPLAVRETMRSARLVFEDSWEAGRESLQPALNRLNATDDAHEGLMSFVERREAQFKGK